ncbi:TonB-dependent receptor plug domain-containing protein [Ancylomarina sp. DW003]|nr:TonB-dependent receptor plug domain-containing protein [Ancylomarina sp. DW003]MDE5423305.1 TonB-dependent receptor plug domain-containing protein [Ancylomarina sp. DW003]
MKLKVVILFCFVLVFRLTTYSQEIKVEAKQQSLNQVLVDLRDRYDVQFSFNDDLLSQFSISVSKRFLNIETAIKFLLKNTSLDYQYTNEVFLIFPNKRKKKYYFQGHLYDFETKESLPFSHLSINDIPQVSDMAGGFSFVSEDDSKLHLKASHLGYFILDTVLSSNKTHKLYLSPANSDLPEILVTDKMVQNFIKIGNQSGNIKLNHKIVNFLPGNGDNSVFELLRMQPGVAASNEQSERVIIWGSYAGETQVLFDRITLWGLKNSYQDIGDINPLVAKHIDIEKGGYDARYGGKIGGFVNITGKDGNKIKPAFSLSLSNVTANASFELPLSKKSSLIAAYRQTYYNLYNDESIYRQLDNSQSNGQSGNDIVLTPEYEFRDMNLKYSFSGDNGDAFFISLLYGSNTYSYGFDQGLYNQIKKSRDKEGKQFGGSILYNKQWENGGKSELFMTSSGMNTEVNSLVKIYKIRNKSVDLRRHDVQEDEVFEYKAGLRHDLNLNKKNYLQLGLTYTYNKLEYSEDSLDVNLMGYNSDFNRLSAFVQNRISFNEKLSTKVGFNMNYPTLTGKIYFDPRVSISYKISELFSMNSAWGIYRQFMSRSIIFDDDGNRRNFWVGSDDKAIPVLRSEHFVLGSSYNKNDFTLSLEAYHKFTRGHTRYFRNRRHEGITTGISQTYGLDFYMKKTVNKHAFWLAYTLGRTEEKFEYGQLRDFQRALQDQTHELKVAGLVNIGKFYCSANYIWGSGFPLYNQLKNTIVSEPNYSRLDVSLIYKLKPGKVKTEFGLMFLNLFNRENINYFNLEVVQVAQETILSINEKTTPFSIRLFFKIGF